MNLRIELLTKELLIEQFYNLLFYNLLLEIYHRMPSDFKTRQLYIL